jgi:predicted PurR-regulated permease PerM
MEMGMPGDDSKADVLRLRRALLALLAAVLALVCLWILRPFLSPMLWAVILAYVTWPIYHRVRVPFRNRKTIGAWAMTLLVCAMAIVPLIWVLVLVQHELSDAYRDFTVYLSQGPHALPPLLREVPGAGKWLQESLDRYSTDPTALGREFTSWLHQWSGVLAAVLGEVGRNIGKLLISVMTLFFFYRDGDLLVEQCRTVAVRFFGDRLDPSIHSAGVITRAVVSGFLITAFAQGLIAGIGYWIVGLAAPVLLGVLTGLLSTAPLLGTAFVWVPSGIWLILTGHTWRGVVLLAWGTVVVHPTDNILRPLLISNVTRVPFLLVMFGALGGLAAFGLIGAFIGPVLLGVAAALWIDWATPKGASSV